MPQKKTKNPLPSSYRGKKRYVQFTLHAEKSLPDALVFSTIQSAFAQWFGTAGLSRAKLHLAAYHAPTTTGVIRVHYRDVARLKVVMILLRKVGNETVAPEIQKTSGSIGKLTPLA